MANYCVAADLYLVYGERNVKAWANLDSSEQAITAVANRVTWACTLATEYVNSRLANGPYAVPFTTVPTMIVNITAMQAGIYLYDGRQVITAMEKDQVTRQRLDVNRYIRQILRGQLKLLNPSTAVPLDKTAYNAPFFVAGDDTEDDDDGTEPTFV